MIAEKLQVSKSVSVVSYVSVSSVYNFEVWNYRVYRNGKLLEHGMRWSELGTWNSVRSAVARASKKVNKINNLEETNR